MCVEDATHARRRETNTHDHGRFHQLIARTKPPAVVGTGGREGRDAGRALVVPTCVIYIRVQNVLNEETTARAEEGQARNPFGRRHVLPEHRTIGGLNEIGNCLNPPDINARFSDPFSGPRARPGRSAR